MTPRQADHLSIPLLVLLVFLAGVAAAVLFQS